ncbi:MAG: hypothetical protein IT233_08225 [Bacteroidia bacterium]|nr:hypothetical protein [Bacteroidia bacterium]
MKKVFLNISFCLAAFAASSQSSEPVFGTFRGNTLINLQTTEGVSPRSFDFTIKHRFGGIGFDSSAWQQFFGLDLPANIRFGFGLPINSRLSVGAGRTKYGKTVDVEVKYVLLQQTEDGKRPVSLAAYFNTAIRTGKFPKVPEEAYYADSVTPFKYEFPHRFLYNTQLIVARKMSEKLSLQLVTGMVYRNLSEPGVDNHTIYAGLGGVFRYKENAAILFEYTWTANRQPSNDAYPLSLGWEFGTAGHVFQIVISSSSELLEQDLYTIDNLDYLKGKFTLGFNIKRTTWIQKDE